MHKTVAEQVGILKRELAVALAFHPSDKPFLSIRAIHERYKFNLRVVKATLREMEQEKSVKLIPRVGIFKNTVGGTDVPVIALIIFEYPAPLIGSIKRAFSHSCRR